MEGYATGDTIVRDASNSRTLDFSNTQLVNIAEVDGGAGNDTIVASNLSAGTYRGGAGNDTLRAGTQDTTWVFQGTGEGYDTFVQNGGMEVVISRALSTGTVIGVDGYANGVDRMEGYATGDTIVRDASNSRTLDFSNTQLVNIAEVDGGAGNDTIVASNLSLVRLPGRCVRGHFCDDARHCGGILRDQTRRLSDGGLDPIDLRGYGLDRETLFEVLEATQRSNDTLLSLPNEVGDPG